MFGRRLQLLREQSDMTQDQVGKVVSLSQQTIGHYEKGRAHPSLETVVLLSKLFNVSTDYLLGLTDDKHSSKKNIRFIGEKLTKLREFKGLTLYELSKITQISEDLLSEIESGMAPSSDIVSKLCEKLRIQELYFYLEESDLTSFLPSDDEFTPYAVLTEKAFRNGVSLEDWERLIDFLIHSKK